jgi:4-carboxymuconolactone decarboxylase
MARVKLIVNKQDIAPEHHALFDVLAALRGRISGPSTVVLHSPGLARWWNEISEYLHRESVVEPRQTELAVIATARETDCGYIWNAHVPLAQKAGVAAQTIDAVRDRRAVAALPGMDGVLVDYVRQLLQSNRVESDVFDRLLKVHGARCLVEVTAWIGRYAALAGILNAFEVTPADPAEVLPATPVSTRRPSRVRSPLSTPRLEPITQRAQVPEEHRPVFDAVAEGRGGVRGPFSILMYSPPLCRRVLDVSTYLRSSARVPTDVRELAIIATARERDCPYVWAAHAPAARKAGASDAAVTAVRERGELGDLQPPQRDVVDYVRQLSRTNRVTQPLFDRLQGHYGVPWLVELTCLIGHYGIVTGILNAFEIAPAPDAEPLSSN